MHTVLQPVVSLVRLNGRRREAVVLPPAHQRGHAGDAGGDQLLHGGALDGQDGLTHGAQHLVCQRQQQHSRAGNGPCRNMIVTHVRFLSALPGLPISVLKCPRLW